MLALLVAQNIAFYVIAALIVFGAIRVVTCGSRKFSSGAT